MIFSNWNKFFNSKNKFIIISAIIFIAFFSFGIFAYKELSKNSNDILVNNVEIEDVASENELKEQLKVIVDNSLQNKVTLKVKDIEKVFTYTDMNLEYDIQKTITEFRKKENKKLENIDDISKINLNLKFDYNKNKLNDLIENLYDEVFVEMKELNIVDDKDFVILKKGIVGESFNKDTVIKKVEEIFSKLNDGEINIEIEENLPTKVTVDDLYNKLYKKPINAGISLSNNKSYKIENHVYGQYVDKKDIKDTLDLFDRGKTETRLKKVYSEPTLMKNELEKNIFRDTLSSFSTNFSTSNVPRSSNIKLAIVAINGTLIPSGKSFSFNNSVGKRSSSNGYMEATVYSNGEITTGIGGGICQVSTTIHNTAIRVPSIDIKSRANHTFTVGYVDLGYDAAVSYGSLDYKFTNNSKWPMKLNASVNGGTINVTIIGTKDDSKTVELSTKKIKDVVYKTVYKDDPEAKVGTEKPGPHSPKNGYVIDTFRTIKENGKIIKNGKIYRSSYRALNKVIYKGTKIGGDEDVIKTPEIKNSDVPIATPKPNNSVPNSLNSNNNVVSNENTLAPVTEGVSGN